MSEHIKSLPVIPGIIFLRLIPCQCVVIQEYVVEEMITSDGKSPLSTPFRRMLMMIFTCAKLKLHIQVIYHFVRFSWGREGVYRFYG